MEQPKPKWLDHTRWDRINNERIDALLTELNALCRAHGFPIAKGGVEISERPGANDLPTITLRLMQRPPDPDRSTSDESAHAFKKVWE